MVLTNSNMVITNINNKLIMILILSDDIPFSGGVKKVVNLSYNTLKSISFLHNRQTIY